MHHFNKYLMVLVFAVVASITEAAEWCCRDGEYYSTDAKAKSAYGDNVEGHCNTGKCSVFIAEVQEGSSYNKLLELFNPSKDDVSLKGYSLIFYHNGVDSRPYHTIPLDEYTLKGRGSWTVCNTKHSGLAKDSCGSNCISCDLETRSMAMNGDDVAELNYRETPGADYTLVDTFGVKGTKQELTICGVRGASKDNTVLRKATVTKGEAVWSKSAGRNCGDCQWLVMPKDYMLDAGIHLHWGATMAGSVPSSGLPFLQFSDDESDNSNNQVSCENFKTAFAGRILEECTEDKLGLGNVQCLKGHGKQLESSKGTKGRPSEDAVYIVFKTAAACRSFATALTGKLVSKEGRTAFTLGCDSWSDDGDSTFAWVSNNYMESNAGAVKALNVYVEDGSLPKFDSSKTTTTAAAGTTTTTAEDGAGGTNCLALTCVHYQGWSQDDVFLAAACGVDQCDQVAEALNKLDGVQGATCSNDKNDDAAGHHLRAAGAQACKNHASVMANIDGVASSIQCDGWGNFFWKFPSENACKTSAKALTSHFAKQATTTEATTTLTTLTTVTTTTVTTKTMAKTTTTTTATTVTTARLCSAGEFLDSKTNGCTPCADGTFRSEPSHSLSECAPHSTKCGADEYVVDGSASRVNDLACKTSEPCPPTQYETKPPVQGSSERECTALTPCRGLEYVKVEATAKSDQACAPCADDAASRAADECRGTTVTTVTATTKTVTTLTETTGTTTTVSTTTTSTTTSATTTTPTTTTTVSTTTNTAEAAAAAALAASASDAKKKKSTNAAVIVVVVLCLLVIVAAAVFVVNKGNAASDGESYDNGVGEHVAFENPLYAADVPAAPNEQYGGGAGDSSGYMDVSGSSTNTASTGYMDVAPNAPAPDGRGGGSGYMDVAPTLQSADPDGFTDDEEV